MTSTDPYPNVRTTTTQTVGFGVHRGSDHPMSANATSMPAAWKTRGVQREVSRPTRQDSVRSFGDIGLDPLRWVTATKMRRLSCGVLIASVTYAVIF